jgi:uncharacterized protein YhaN
MRIESLYIDGFGIFTQRAFGPFNAPVTIFDGENETGKSTLLAFIRTVLYGFPSRHRDEHYPPIRGGKHGGHIVVTAEDGIRYKVERYVAAKGGSLSVKGEDGTSFPESKLRVLLGHSSKEKFENYFAFGLDELREMNSSDGEEMQGLIYSAALGAINVVGAQKIIEKKKDSIFLNSGRMGRNQKIGEIFPRLEDVERQLLSHSQDAPRYAGITNRIEQITEDVASLEKNRVQLKITLDRQGKLLNVRDDLIEIHVLEDKLSGLSESPKFPQDGVTRLENFRGQVLELEEVVRQVTETVEKLEKVVATPLPGAKLLEDAEAIRQSTGEESRIQRLIDDLPGRTEKVNESKAEVARFLTELGPDWDTPRLEEIDMSLPVKDQVNQKKAEIIDLVQKVSKRENDKESAEKELRIADDSVKQAAAELERAVKPAHDEAGLAKRRVAINKARSGSTRLSKFQLDLSQLQAAGGHIVDITGSLPILAMALGLVFLGIGSAAWGFVGNGDMFAIVIGVLSLAIGVGLAVLSYWNRKPTQISAHISDVAFQIAQVEKELADAKKILGLDSVDHSRLEIAQEELDANTRQWNDVQNLETVHRNAIRASDQRKQDLEHTSSALSESKKELAGAGDGWKLWLRKLSFMETMSTDAVLELFSGVEAARLSVTNLRERQVRLNEMKDAIKEIRDLVAPLAQKHGVLFDVDNSSTYVPAINELSSKFGAAQGEQKELEGKCHSLAEEKERLEKERRSLQKVRDDVRNILKLGGTDDPEEFRRLAAAHDEYQECHNKLEQLNTTIQRIFAVKTDTEALRAEIGERSRSALEESVEETKSSLDEVERERDDLTKGSTLAEKELSELGASDQASGLMAERETLLDELRELGSEWSKYSLALLMLRKARDRHERERQPKVLQTASEFFKDITGTRYSGLRVPAGEPTVIAVTPSGEGMQASQLSRGTREQMYLSLKLGAIHESSQHNTPLPVIVDDALVNSDLGRSRVVARAFAKLGDTNQVLVFTCHPTLVQQLQEACPDAQVQKLDLQDVLTHPQ